MKVRVHTVLKTENENKEFSGFGILLNDCLKYIEDDVKVVVILNNQEMIREDNEKKVSYKFLENAETVNDLFLIDYNLTCPISIYTNKFLIESNRCHIEYKLVLDELIVDYQVWWEEVK